MIHHDPSWSIPIIFTAWDALQSWRHGQEWNCCTHLVTLVSLSGHVGPPKQSLRNDTKPKQSGSHGVAWAMRFTWNYRIDTNMCWHQRKANLAFGVSTDSWLPQKEQAMITSFPMIRQGNGVTLSSAHVLRRSCQRWWLKSQQLSWPRFPVHRAMGSHCRSMWPWHCNETGWGLEGLDWITRRLLTFCISSRIW